MDIKIGADPEVFLFDQKKNEYVSAAGFFPGTKKEPFKVDKGAIQVDGVALEFNIDPAENEEEFFQNIRTVHRIMEKMVTDVNKDWKIKHVPIVYFSKELWNTVPEEAKELGCDPDFAYTGIVNPNPSERICKDADRRGVGAIRTGSGHIHIGWSDNESSSDPSHFEDCRACANYFSLKNAFGRIVAYSPLDGQRHAYYGMSGAFRPKKYGVELRSLSNRWLETENSIRETYRTTKVTFDRFANGV